MRRNMRNGAMIGAAERLKSLDPISLDWLQSLVTKRFFLIILFLIVHWKMCAPSEDSDQPAHSRSLIRIFTGRILDRQECKVSSRGQGRLIRLCGSAGWFESWLGAHIRKYVSHVVAPILLRISWQNCVHLRGFPQLSCTREATSMDSCSTSCISTLSLVLLNKLRCHAPSNFQPIRLLDPDCCYKFTDLMANSADPDQLASSEANWSGSTLFVKPGYIRVQQDKG